MFLFVGWFVHLIVCLLVSLAVILLWIQNTLIEGTAPTALLIVRHQRRNVKMHTNVTSQGRWFIYEGTAWHTLVSAQQEQSEVDLELGVRNYAQKCLNNIQYIQVQMMTCFISTRDALSQTLQFRWSHSVIYYLYFFQWRVEPSKTLHGLLLFNTVWPLKTLHHAFCSSVNTQNVFSQNKIPMKILYILACLPVG